MRYELYTGDGTLVGEGDTMAEIYEMMSLVNITEGQVFDTVTGTPQNVEAPVAANRPTRLPFKRVGVHVRVHPDDRPLILEMASELNRERSL